MRQPPFLRVGARSLAPLVWTCEHASNRMPLRRRAGSSSRAILRTHWGWDIGAWSLTRQLVARLGGSAIGGRWSRLLIDLNRRVDDPTLIRTCAEGVELEWNRTLGPEEIERRVLAYHAPYHLELDRLILRRLVRGIRPLVVAVHSFTPVYEGRMRRFDAGVLFEHHVGLARKLARGMRAGGLSVRYNQPYSGLAGMMYAVDRHGSHHRLPCLELELNQELLRDRARIPRVANAVARGIADVLR